MNGWWGLWLSRLHWLITRCWNRVSQLLLEEVIMGSRSAANSVLSLSPCEVGGGGSVMPGKALDSEDSMA